MSVIDDYLATVEEPKRVVLEHVRNVIKGVAPDAVDTIGYGMPVLKQDGKYLIGFSAFKNHMSIFPGANPAATTQAKLNHFKTSKGTIQFTVEQQIPEAVLVDIVLSCLERTAKN